MQLIRLRNRKRNRLKGYNYSQDGWYFLTICVKNREYSLGDIVNGEMRLSEIGGMAEKYWQEIPDHYKNVKLDEYIIMPNHLHGIIIIENDDNTVGTEQFCPCGWFFDQGRTVFCPCGWRCEKTWFIVKNH